jgi:serine-type D-Ala-D-Ala carboxypeptidase/endopeptidase (penicillin-binding protein 4)
VKLFLITVILSLAVTLTSATLCRAGLDDDLRSILADKSLARAQVGVAIAAIDSAAPRRVFSYHAQTPLMPASNMKICTTSAALDLLGPDFKFRTTLLIHNSDAILVGDGDPSFGDAELLKSINWTATTTFEKWAEELKRRNITSIRNILVDDSIFDQTFFQPTWPTSQSGAGYEAEVAGLTLNAGISIKPISRNGKQAVVATVHDPALYTAGVFAEVLKSSSIPVTGTISRDLTVRARYLAGSNQFHAVAIHQTPLATILARCNKDSMNVYAESLCKRLGYETTHEPGTWTSGAAAVSAFLQKAGADPAQYHLEDGCGLSRNDRVSPETLLHVLTYNYNSRHRDAFINSLAIAGVDGTLERRFQGTLKSRIFAKTGYINGVSSLSGYLKTESDHWFAFSILFNNVPGGVGKPTQEKLLTTLDKLAR